MLLILEHPHNLLVALRRLPLICNVPGCGLVPYLHRKPQSNSWTHVVCGNVIKVYRIFACWRTFLVTLFFGLKSLYLTGLSPLLPSTFSFFHIPTGLWRVMTI